MAMRKISQFIVAAGIIAILAWFARSYLTGCIPVTTGQIGEIDPSPSPDGEWLAYRSFTKEAPETGELWIQSASGTAHSPRQLVSGNNYDGGESWSPKSEWISYIGWPNGSRVGSVESQVFRVNPSTGQQIQLTRENAAQVGESTSWSVTDQIAFVMGNEICEVSPSGGAVQKISNFSALSPQPMPRTIAWSPDGKLVAFSAAIRGDEDHRSLWVLNVKASTATRLTQGPYDDQPVWIDNNTVVFNQGVSEKHPFVLSRLDTNTGKVKRIRDDGVYFSSGYAAPTGRFYFARGSKVDSDGKDLNLFRGFHIFRTRTPWFSVF